MSRLATSALLLLPPFVALGYVLPSFSAFLAIVSSAILGALLALWLSRRKLAKLRGSDSHRESEGGSLLEAFRDEISAEIAKKSSSSNTTIGRSVSTDGHLRGEDRSYFKTLGLLVSKNVDPVIEQLIDFSLRDYLLIWYKELIKSDTDLDFRLKNELWVIVSRLLARFGDFDEVTFITRDAVNKITRHFHKVNLCHQQHQSYELSAHLESREKEVAFLRKVADLILAILLPKVYLDLKPLKHLLREIVAIQVLYNSIELLCDPDYLNQKILDYIQWNEIESERKRRQRYAYAETYDDFIDMIKESDDVEDLKRMRYYIVSEIMQATAINNLKRERGLDLTKEGASSSAPGSNVKGDHLLARNLPRYINQLRYAKRLCEKRIHAMGDEPERDSKTDLSLPQPNKKMVFGFNIIMNSDLGRSCFRQFLQDTVGKKPTISEKTAKYLVLFWESVEVMKREESLKQYEVAHELLNHSYFLNSIKNHIKLPKDVFQGMESFIMGNTGPESFLQTQKVVYRILEDRYYPLFIVSKDYDEMIHNDEASGQPFDDYHVSQELREERARSTSPSNVNSSIIEDHIVFAKSNLKKTEQKLKDKRDALAALKKSTDFSSKATSVANIKRVQKLAKEADEILDEMHLLECHVQRSELWVRHLRQWRAELYSLQTESTTERDATSLAVIIVHLGSMSGDLKCDGWVVTRTIHEVIELKRKLVKKLPYLKKIEILRLRNVSEDRDLDLINKAKANLNLFIQLILKDETCLASEELYLFFIPSAEHLRLPLTLIKNPQFHKFKLPFASLFGINSLQPPILSKQVSNVDHETDEDVSRLLDDIAVKENAKDDIAEPVYHLVNEIFELQGTVGWLRKTLIGFVQLSYGKTINKQVRETVSWVCSESMLHYYLVSFRDAMWPDGAMAAPWLERSEQQKADTHAMTKKQLLNGIPDVLSNLLGNENARKGMTKVFDILQHKQLNKQLFYELLEVFLFEFAPELKHREAGSKVGEPEKV